MAYDFGDFARTVATGGVSDIAGMAKDAAFRERTKRDKHNAEVKAQRDAAALKATKDAANEAAKKAAAKAKAEREALAAAKKAAQDKIDSNTSNIADANSHGDVFAPAGNDMYNPGTGEQAVGIHGGEFFEPGKEEGYFGAHSGAFSKPGVGERTGNRVSGKLERGANNTATGNFYSDNADAFSRGGGRTASAFDSFAPSVDANMDAFYSNAADKGQADLARAAAATGSFGSSRAMQTLAGFSSDLRGNQAQHNAQYVLDRQKLYGDQANMADDNERQFLVAGGNAASAADDARYKYLTGAADTGFKSQDARESRIKTGSAIWADIDAGNDKRRTLGIDAYGKAQDARERRVGSVADNRLKYAELLLKYGGDSIKAQAEAVAQGINLDLAGATDDYRGDVANANNLERAGNAIPSTFPSAIGYKPKTVNGSAATPAGMAPEAAPGTPKKDVP